MSILSKLFGSSDDNQAQPKDESWQVDTTVSADEFEQLAITMARCAQCSKGYICAAHNYQLLDIEFTEE